MRTVIDHYVSKLTERNELDVLVRNLLIARGDEVVKRAFQGEKEYGVDVASVRKEDDGIHLYLFQVKTGDFTRAQWDSDSSNSVRSSLHEAIDAPLKVNSQLPEEPVKRHLIVVFNGDMKSDVRAQFEGVVDAETRRKPNIEITQWNQSTLVNLCMEHLFDDALFTTVDRDLLKKLLAFADASHYGFRELWTLLGQVLKEITTKSKPGQKKAVKKTLATVRALTRMIAEYARQGNAFKNAVLASEIGVLTVADWLMKHHFDPPIKEASCQLLLDDHLQNIMQLAERLEPFLTTKDGLYMGVPGEEYELPLRAYDILGFLSTGVLISRERHNPEATLRLTGLLKATLHNQTGTHRPQLDHHGIELALTTLALGNGDEADRTALRAFITKITTNLVLRSHQGLPLPEFRNDIRKVIEYHATGERPEGYVDSSSTLVWPLLEWMHWLNTQPDDATRKAFQKVNLQVWYPPKEYQHRIFTTEIRDGHTEIGLTVPQNPQELDGHIQLRLQHYTEDCIHPELTQRDLKACLWIAHRHHRTPVFASHWRKAMLQSPTETGAQEASTAQP